MKIKLIVPRANAGVLGMRVPNLFGKQRYGGPPLSLLTIAALTPSNIDISIVDENVENIDFSERVDLVGLSFNVAGAPRAYEIAREYRAKSVPVIMGGVYASMLSAEVQNHCDTVVIGEAEDVWGSVLKDASDNRLKNIYQSSNNIELANSPIPRWNLIRSDTYNYCSIQTTRGCPFDCDYCSITYLFGKRYRHKPVDNVIREVETLKKIMPGKLIFFVDDNLISNAIYVKQLLRALITCKVHYSCQVPITVANDDELLALLKESGCREVFIGIESVSQGSLDNLGKGRVNRVEQYDAAVNKIFSYGISIFGSFMLGGDCDDGQIFKHTVNFVQNYNIPFALINILVPPPGTRFFNRLKRENRIIHFDYSQYTGENVTFRPLLMDSDSLQQGYYWTLRRIYSYANIYHRLSYLWSKGILLSKSKRLSFYKFKILSLLMLDSVIRLKFDRVVYLIKCVFDSHSPSLTPILLGVSMHEYTESLVNRISKAA